MIFSFIEILIYFIVLIFFIEILIHYSIKLKNFFLYKEKSRQEFLNPEYHKYLIRYESSKPMFKYLPIGLRYFNSEDEEIIGVQNNSLGFRCSEFTEKKENVTRIVILGGSAAWGSGASNNDNTISGHLEKILKKKNENSNFKIECLNLAQINNYISQDLLNANLFFEKLKPNFVVSFAGWNEIAASYLLDQKNLKKFGTYFMEEVGEIGPISLPSYKKELMKNFIKSYIINNSKILSIFKKNKNDKNLFDEKKFKEEINLSSEIFVNHVQKFHLMSKGYEFEYLQFLQPHIYKKNI